MIIDVKEAVQVATEALSKFYEGRAFSDITLEEVELSENQAFWYITLSFVKPSPGATPFDAMMGSGGTRVYKLFTIDANNKRVISMKIKSL